MGKVGSKPKTKNKNGKRPAVDKAFNEMEAAKAKQAKATTGKPGVKVPAPFSKMETIAYDAISAWREEKEAELKKTIAAVQAEFQNRMNGFLNEVIASRGLTGETVKQYDLDVDSGTFKVKDVEDGKG